MKIQHIRLFTTCWIFLTINVGLCQSNPIVRDSSSVIFATFEENQKIHWLRKNLINGEVTDLGLFGDADWEPMVGNWIDPEFKTRAAIYRGVLGQFFLRLAEPEIEFTIGIATQPAVIIAGEDLDSSGISDVVMIVQRDNFLSWRFSFDPFSDFKSFRRVLFGNKNTVPFLFRARGPKDSLAFISRNRIIYRGLYSKLRRYIRVPQLESNSAPRRMRGLNNRDILLFEESVLSEDGSRIVGLTVNSLAGRRIQQHTFYGEGQLILGNFGGSIEDFGYLKNSGDIELSDGSVIQLSITGGIPVQKELNRFFEFYSENLRKRCTWHVYYPVHVKAYTLLKL
jgi:hypothetical protein